MVVKSTGRLLPGMMGLALMGIGGCMGTPVDDVLSNPELPTANVLRALTAGDAAEAFVNFRNGLDPDAQRELGLGITAEQRSRIEQLQARFDEVELSEDEFGAAVADALQDTEPTSPFAGFRFLGSPFSTGGVNDFAELLELSGAQRQEALEVYRALHADIARARNAAQTQIRGVLNEAQQTMLDQIAGEVFQRADIAAEQQPAARLAFDVITQRLGLTLEQQDQITSVREFLRGVTEALHVQARAEFLGLLDDSQARLLDTVRRM